jgi:hypothetical protein
MQPILLSDETGGRQVNLAPGEAAFTAQGVRQRRAGPVAGTDGAPYYALELIVADAAANPETLGTGTAIFTSDPFTAPAGYHDLDLVRDVLGPGESSFVGAGQGPTLVLAVGPMLRVVPTAGPDVTLRDGEAAMFTGELEVQAGLAVGGAFVAAVIGSEVPELAISRPAAAATTTAMDGLIYVGMWTCPLGMTPESFDPDSCDPVFDGFDFELTGGTPRGDLTLADASTAQLAVQFQWQELAYGD